MRIKYLYIRPIQVLWKEKFKQNKTSLYNALESCGFTCSYETLSKWLDSYEDTFDVEIRHFPGLINSTHIPYKYFIDKELADKFTVNDVVEEKDWIKFWIDIDSYFERFNINRMTQDAISKHLDIDRDTLRCFYNDREYLKKSKLPATKVLRWLYWDGCTVLIHGGISKYKQSDVEKTNNSRQQNAADDLSTSSEGHSIEQQENSQEDIPGTGIIVDTDNSECIDIDGLIKDIDRYMQELVEKNIQDKAMFLTYISSYTRIKAQNYKK